MTLVWKSGLNLQSPASNDPLLDLNTQPSLDLQFAAGKTLDDRVSGNNLVTFSRASTGTYVDSDGLIKNSPVNLFTYSDTLSGWSLSNATRAVSSTNPPFGSGNASSFTATGVSTVYPFGGLASNSPSGTYTFTIYTTFTQSFSFLGYGSGFGLLVLFDVDTKQPSTVTLNSGTNATNINSSVTSEEGGWYKIQVTFTTTGVVSEATVALNKNKATAWGLSNSSVVGDTLALFGAQLEEGTTATDYIPTTTTISGAPRFDHDPLNGESLGLLIEESRTNLITRSTATGAVNGVIGSGGSLPSGWNTDQVQLGTTLEVIGSGTEKGLTYVDIRFFGTTGNLNRTLVRPGNNISLNGETYYLTAYSKLVSGTNNLNYTNFEGGALSLTSELKRNTGATRSGFTGTFFPRFDIGLTSIGVSYDVTIRFAAPQMELGSFPTTYIPTSGSTVTRAADLASITGTNFSSWYNQSEGTVFADRTFTINNGHTYYFADSSLTSNRIRLQAITHSGNNSSDGSFFQGSVVGNKTALGLQTDNVAVNGGTPDTSFTVPSSLDRLFIGRHPTVSSYLNGHIARLAYYPYRLTDTTLQEITS